MLKQLSAKDFLAQFDPEIHQAIRDSVKKFQSIAVVRFVNMQMDSSSLGDSSALGVGPNNTYKTVAETDGKWLKDLPSQRQYADSYCDDPELIQH